MLLYKSDTEHNNTLHEKNCYEISPEFFCKFFEVKKANTPGDDARWMHVKRTTTERHLENRSGEDMDSRIQAALAGGR